MGSVLLVVSMMWFYSVRYQGISSRACAYVITSQVEILSLVTRVNRSRVWFIKARLVRTTENWLVLRCVCVFAVALRVCLRGVEFR